MDYIFLSTLVKAPCSRLLIVYDIACQWSKRLFQRIHGFPNSMRIALDPMQVTFAIPKGHIKSHGKDCQSRFSLNYLPGSARTDGEGIERDWAQMNALVPSVREMGPGNRRETLDDHWGGWNWEKVKKLGMSIRISVFLLIETRSLDEFLYRKLFDALKNHQLQFEQHTELTNSISAEKRQKWDAEIERWNDDKSQRDPYEDTEQGALFLTFQEFTTYFSASCAYHGNSHSLS